MNALLYYNKSSDNTINKELEYIKTYDIKLHKDFNYVTGSITINSNDLINGNYIYLPDLKRYYFIDSKVIVSAKAYILNLSVDVLESFKNEILNSNCLIKKCDDYNKYYDDGSYKNEVRKEVTTYKSDVKIDYDNPATILVTLGGVQA